LLWCSISLFILLAWYNHEWENHFLCFQGICHYFFSYDIAMALFFRSYGVVMCERWPQNTNFLSGIPCPQCPMAACEYPNWYFYIFQLQQKINCLLKKYGPSNTSEKREQNSKKIIWLQFLYLDKMDVTNIFLESHFGTLITFYWRFDSFFKAYNLFQINWNFVLFHMYNETSTKFQHVCLIDECWN